MTRPTQATLEALRRCKNGPLRRVHDVGHGRPAWPAHPASLAALVRRELVARSERKSKTGHRVDEWTITDAGRDALKPPAPKVMRERRWYLAAKPNCVKDDYTSDPSRAMFGEPEAVPPYVLDESWFGAALERHAEERDRRERSRQFANRRKAA